MKLKMFKDSFLPVLEDPPFTLVDVETAFELELIGDDAADDKYQG